MITNDHSWSLGSYPNKSFAACEAPVRRRFQSAHLTFSSRNNCVRGSVLCANDQGQFRPHRQFRDLPKAPPFRMFPPISFVYISAGTSLKNRQLNENFTSFRLFSGFFTSFHDANSLCRKTWVR